MTRNVMNVWVAMALVVLGLSAVGCGQSKLRLGRYDLVVSPDASLRDAGSGKIPQVEVDLVGVRDADKAEWAAYSVDKYFSGEDPMRAGAAKYTRTVTFGPDNNGPATIKSNDPIWQEWEQRGVTTLYVFASARTMKTGSGGADLRRKEIPLTTDRWESGTNKIDVVVKSSGVDCPTPMKVMK